MLIHSATTFLIRHEIDHIEDWLMHQHYLGCSQVTLFVEDEAVDSRCGSEDRGRVWSKKANEAVFSTGSIIGLGVRLGGICERVMRATGMRIRTRGSVTNWKSFCSRQKDNIHWLMREYHMGFFAAAPDWLLTCDVDEYIVTTSGSLPDYLDTVGDGVAAIKMRQVFMKGRWDKQGKPIPVDQITEGWGAVSFNPKVIIRVAPSPAGCGTFALRSIHGKGSFYGAISCPNPTDLRFHHFRGAPDEETVKKMPSRCLKKYLKVSKGETKVMAGHRTQRDRKPQPPSSAGYAS